MKQINDFTNLNITVYHRYILLVKFYLFLTINLQFYQLFLNSFHDEVDLFRKHIWKCDGSC